MSDDEAPRSRTATPSRCRARSSTYTLTRHGDVYSCTCPAWRNQGAPIDRRTCKHLRAYLGDDAETARIGVAAAAASATATAKQGRRRAAKATAPPILLAHKWETEHDPTGWWMSEKLDGVRAYWDGETFVSRLGNQFHAPDWFIADLPADPLDGELWVGRKMFQRTTSIVRSGAAERRVEDGHVRRVRRAERDGPFEERLAHAQKVLEDGRARRTRAGSSTSLCEGLDHLREELARVEALGGEGLMLRQPGSKYEVGRSSTLLKVKTFHDAEARVVGHAPGTGKHKGRLGALIVRAARRHAVHRRHRLLRRRAREPAGDRRVITFRYQELSDDGVPRFPIYVGERLDVKLPAPPTSKATPMQKRKPGHRPKP